MKSEGLRHDMDNMRLRYSEIKGRADMTQPDRLTLQLAQAQLAEIAEMDRAIMVYGGLLAEYERRLADARARLTETKRRVSG